MWEIIGAYTAYMPADMSSLMIIYIYICIYIYIYIYIRIYMLYVCT